MAPKVPPPSDPTSLLWAHQMKREHAFLLSKVEKLEGAISRIEALAIAAENRETDVAAIAQRVQTLADESGHKNSAAAEQAVEKIRQEVSTQFEDLDERLEAIINKLDAVDRAGETAASNRKDAFEREMEMLRRVKGIEASLKTYRDSLRKLGRKIDDGGVEQIRTQLTTLVQWTNDAGEDQERIKTTLAMLENATEALKRENEKLDGQLSEVREEAKARAAEAAMAARSSRMETVIKPVPDARANALGTKLAANVEPTAAGPAPKPATAPVRKGRVKKSTDAPVKPTGDKSMKRELAGLMTDVSPHDAKRRTIKAPISHGPAFSKPAGQTVEGALLTDEKTQKQIVRQGKGWIQVVEVVSDDDDDEDLAELAKLVPPSNAKQVPERKSSTDFAGNPLPVKRGPGRPRKNPNPASSTPAVDHAQSSVVKRGPGRPRKLVEQVSVQRSIEQEVAPAPKRRVIEQNDNTQARAIFGTTAKGKKRKADADAIDDTIDLSAPRASRSRQGTPAPVTTKRQKHNVAKAAEPVHLDGKAKIKSRGSTPAVSKAGRKVLNSLPTSSNAPPPANSDPVHDSLDATEHAPNPSVMAKVQKVSRKRTIPQIDDGLANTVFDKDFEM